MTVKLYNLARASTSTTGSGTITLGSTVAGCLSFPQAGVQDGDVISYGIIDGNDSEVGRGVYGASGSTLTRVVLKSTNSNNPLVLTGTGVQCYITALAEDFVFSGSNAIAGSRDISWDIDGYLATGSLVGTFIATRSMTLGNVYIYSNSTGTSGCTIVDVNKNGTTIFVNQDNRPFLAYNDGDKVAKSGTPDIVSVSENDIISFDIDQVAVGALDLSVVIACEATGNTAIAGSSVMSDTTGSIVKHNLSGVTSGSYDKFIVDSFGHITSASSINSSTYLKLDASNDPMSGSLSMGDYGLQRVGTIELSGSYVPLGTEQAGTIYYDTANHTLSVALENGVTLQTGQEMHIYGKNVSGSPIINGCAVQVTSALGSWTAFKYASATSPEAYATIGIATQTIADNAFGYVTIQGVVRDIDTSMYDEGKPIYLDPTMNGRMTKAYPTAPNYVVNMGVVEYKHQNEGRINVIKLIVPKLQDLSDVNGTPLTSNGQFLVYNASGSYFDATANINSLIAGSSVMSNTSGSIIKHNASGVTTGSYNKVIVDTFGHVTSASVVPIPLTSTSVANRHLVGYDATTGSFISDTSIQFQVDTQRYGFMGTPETSLSFNGSSVLTLTDSGSGWSYYRTGVKHTISGNKTATISTPEDGRLYFFYIDDTAGTISVSNSSWTLNDTKVPVATVYLHSTGSPTFIMADERHTCLIDRRLHRFEHFAQGTEIVGACTIDGYIPNSSADADKTFGISATTIADEDLFFTLNALADPSGSSLVYYNVYRTSVTSGSVLAKWVWDVSDMPFKYTGTPGAYSYMHYDLNGTSTPAGNNQYVNTYLLLTNVSNNNESYGTTSGSMRYMILQGKAMFASATLATGEKFTSFDLSGFPVAEAIAVKQITWRTNQTASIKGRNVLISVQDISNNVISTVTTSTTDHNGLAGLQGGAIGEYFHLTNYQHDLISTGCLITGSGVMSDTSGCIVKHNVSGVTTGSYNKVIVDTYGHVTSASIVAVPQTVTPVSGSVITGYNATTGSFTSGSVSSSGGGHIIQSAGSTLATEPVLNFINNEIVDSSGSTVVRNWNKHNQEIVTGTTVTIESTESAIFVGGYTVTGTLNVYGKLVVL